MKTIKQLAIVACAALAFSCAKEDATQSRTETVSGDPCEVNLIISAAETKGITDDFVDGTDLESKVNVLEFYVFDKDGKPDTEVGRVDENTPGTGYKRIATASNEKVHKITMAGGNDKKIVAVINMELGDFVEDEIEDYATLKAALAKWVYTASGSTYNARTENRTYGFEMTGEKVPFSVTAGSVNNNITINVSRLSTRINAPVFKNTQAGFVDFDQDDLEEIWGDDAEDVDGLPLTYVNEGYVVINGRAKSDAFFIGNAEENDRKTKVLTTGGTSYTVPDWSTWAGGTVKPCLASAFTATADKTGTYTSTYSGKGVADDWFLNGKEANNEHRVYVFENKPESKTVNGITGYDPASTYALIVKGTLVVDGDSDNDNGLNRTRYWRVDLTRDDDYHVFRNCSYAITINKVSTPGYGSPEEAEKGNPVIPGKDQTAADVKIVVSGWRINNYETGM